MVGQVTRGDGSIRQVIEKQVEIQLDGDDYLLINYIDATEQFALRQQVAQAHSVLQNSPDAILFLDADGRVTFQNRTFSQVFNLPNNDIIDLQIPAKVHEKMMSALREGVHWREETLVGNSEGQLIPVDLIAVPFHKEQTGGSLILSDLSEQKAAREEQRMLEQRIYQTQKMESIGLLAAGIAHEINTPTQFVGDNIRFLRDSFTDLDELVKEYDACLTRNGVQDEAIAEKIDEVDLEYLGEEIPKAIDQSLEGVGRITSIVSAMKEFSHPGDGQLKREDLNHAVQNAVAVARNEWKYYSTVELELDEQLPSVLCRLGEINQVILNLIVNAAHAINEKAQLSGNKDLGVITIRSQCVGDRIQLRIKDTGTGIDEEVQDQVFNPFFTTKEIGTGTGQGLAITYDIIHNKHGGRVWFETALNEGTEFIVELPVNGVPREEGTDE